MGHQTAEMARPHGFGPTLAESARRRGPTLGQLCSWSALSAALSFATALATEITLLLIILGAGAVFVWVACWRLLLLRTSLWPTPAPPPPAAWPRYTILAALHDEAEVVAQLVRRLARLDYPVDRLEGFLLLEAHDQATIEAAVRLPRPSWLQVLVCPPGSPRTKPRALNFGLAHGAGELITVYDAEDEPDPGQLKAAAARLMAEPDLGCVQAPLRIRRGTGQFLDRQLALEYASLFEVTLPGMARLGLPFPLGGTSNHFRASALKAVGGWDAWNVTEDADLGFRLWRHGWRLDVIPPPTWETPPGRLRHWLPQRNRWLKGFLQTWGVHTRNPAALGFRGGFALFSTLGVGLASAAAHGPSVAYILAAVLVAGFAGIAPATPWPSMVVLAFGAAAAWLSSAVGARRAGMRYRLSDMATAPFYWSLLSLAFVHALWRLVTEPFAWDKTPHRADEVEEPPSAAIPLAPVAGREAA